MAAQEIDTQHVDEGQTTGGAPAAPADTGREKPEGFDEQHGSPAEKEGQQQAKADEGTKDTGKTPDATTEQERPKEQDTPLREYVTLDHPAGQAAINLLKQAGVDPNEANTYFAQAIASNDITKVDWAGLEKRVGADTAYLIRTGAEKYYADQEATAKQVLEATFTIFNGKENFDKVKEWAKKKEAVDHEFGKRLDDIRDLLNAGGAKAEAGARELLRLHNADPTTTGLNNGKLVVGDSTGNVIGTPLSRAEYLAELKSAHERNAPAHVINSINARRKAGQAQGL